MKLAALIFTLPLIRKEVLSSFYKQIPTETILKEVTLLAEWFDSRGHALSASPCGRPLLGTGGSATASVTTQENPRQRFPVALSPLPLPQDTLSSWIDLWSKSLKSEVDKNPSVTNQDRYKPQDNLFSNGFSLKVWFGIGFLTTNSCRQFSHWIKTSVRQKVEFSPLWILNNELSSRCTWSCHHPGSGLGLILGGWQNTIEKTVDVNAVRVLSSAHSFTTTEEVFVYQ